MPLSKTSPIAQNTKLAKNWKIITDTFDLSERSGNDDVVERDYDLRNYNGSFWKVLITRICNWND